MSLLLPLALAACIEGEPVALPEPTPPPAVEIDARMVSAGSVTGYLGRPLVEEAVPAELLLIDAHDEASRAEVARRTAGPAGVLAITTEVDPRIAEAYLEAMPWTTSTSRVCLRREPCTATAGEAARPATPEEP